ncbi:MAG TPA: patatin-like phospholipase family protein [Deltaproteobacteria bacterium]|nr:patatin-like phospholipase family protein [Deltaproteobacteria bacterium]HPR53284.1 patatin-like phospholipase family protein [Deltaproteobacteria bacterium]
MGDNLSIYAGARARAFIEKNGLTPESIGVVTGAAGGPKWLVLGGLDRAIFFSWMKGRKDPLPVVGSSIGSWRFSAVALGERAYDAFERAYIDQTYKTRPSPGDVTRESVKILGSFLTEENCSSLMEHPYLRLCIMSAYCGWPFSRQDLLSLAFGMISVSALNALSRNMLKLFFSRAIFHDARMFPPFKDVSDFPLQRIPITRENLRDAILASGSIPLVMEGVKDITGARPGIYRDGGVIDYHINLAFDSDRIVLFPHYVNTIIPGWFDKFLSGRGPKLDNLENVVVLCPSEEFVARLPYAKIPTRKDFRGFRGRNEERISYWEQVVSASESLGEEFLALVEGDGILKRIKPISSLTVSPKPRT